MPTDPSSLPSTGRPQVGGTRSSGFRYAGAVAGLATRHGKLPLIAPALAPLGLDVVLVPEVDTDAYGTFTGEVTRTGTAVETVLAKATAAAQESGLRLGLASEGSFGPHPAVPMLALDIELVAFLDTAADLRVLGRASFNRPGRLASGRHRLRLRPRCWHRCRSRHEP